MHPSGSGCAKETPQAIGDFFLYAPFGIRVRQGNSSSNWGVLLNTPPGILVRLRNPCTWEFHEFISLIFSYSFGEQMKYCSDVQCNLN